MTTEIERWDARGMDWEDDDFYALMSTSFDMIADENIVVHVQHYYGDKTGHRIDLFAETPDGCREITLESRGRSDTR